MNDPAAIGEILKMYEKHGWTLRRVLLSRPAPKDLAELFRAADVRQSDIDALWFARPSHPGNVAWEIRALTTTPFALLEVVPDDTDPAELEETLASAQSRMQEMLVRGRSKDN